MLKDAALTALVAAALGIFIVGFRTVDVGSRTGLSFDYQLVDLAVAVVVIFFGRLGLSLAADRPALAGHRARHGHDRGRRLAAASCRRASCTGSWRWAACCW